MDMGGQYEHELSSPGKRSREKNSGSIFGRKVPKEDTSPKRGGGDAVLDYGELYPSKSDSKLNDVSSNNPKHSKDEARNDAMHYDEDFEYKDREGSSDSDNASTKRDSRGIKGARKKSEYKGRDNSPKGSRSARDTSPKGPRSEITISNNTTPERTAKSGKTNNLEYPITARGYPGSQECTSIEQGFPSVLTAYKSGIDADCVQCVIVRNRAGFQAKIFPNYELRLQSTNKLLMVAMKMNMNRTSNYHLFDMTRGTTGKTLTKKSGNYVGKLRAKNPNRTEYIVLNHSSEKQEVGGFMFDREDPSVDAKDGVRPRKLWVILPKLAGDGRTVPNSVPDNDSESSIIEILRASSSDREGTHIFQTKEPTFVNGNYRLDFHGRVSVASVKNFQLVGEEDLENVVCLFGKVDHDRFHLDFKTPFNAFQAFALALSQFNL